MTRVLILVSTVLGGCTDYSFSSEADFVDDLDTDGDDDAHAGGTVDDPDEDSDDPASDDPDDDGEGGGPDGSGGPGGDGPTGEPPEQFDDCYALAEAWDMGWLRVHYDGSNHNVINNGPGDVCIDDWYAFFSDISQDAALGEEGISVSRQVVIESGGAQPFTYAPDNSYGEPAWFCIEQSQTTTPNEAFWFNGARAPEPLNSMMDGGTMAEQESIWADIDTTSMILVGRVDNVLDLTVGEQRTVQIEALNLGRLAGSATIVEHVPPYLKVVESGSASVTYHTDGARTLRWEVSLDGAIDTAQHLPTDYDIATLSYTVELASCPGERTVGYQAASTYDDGVGYTWTAQSSPLITWCE